MTELFAPCLPSLALAFSWPTHTMLTGELNHSRRSLAIACQRCPGRRVPERALELSVFSQVI